MSQQFARVGRPRSQRRVDDLLFAACTAIIIVAIARKLPTLQINVDILLKLDNKEHIDINWHIGSIIEGLISKYCNHILAERFNRSLVKSQIEVYVYTCIYTVVLVFFRSFLVIVSCYHSYSCFHYFQSLSSHSLYLCIHLYHDKCFGRGYINIYNYAYIYFTYMCIDEYRDLLKGTNICSEKYHLIFTYMFIHIRIYTYMCININMYTHVHVYIYT
jgi:hypothetical protein